MLSIYWQIYCVFLKCYYHCKSLMNPRFIVIFFYLRYWSCQSTVIFSMGIVAQWISSLVYYTFLICYHLCKLQWRLNLLCLVSWSTAPIPQVYCDSFWSAVLILPVYRDSPHEYCGPVDQKTRGKHHQPSGRSTGLMSSFGFNTPSNNKSHVPSFTRRHMANVKKKKRASTPCFSRGDPIGNLCKRFHLEMSEREAANFMIRVCTDAYNQWTTAGYDLIQYLQQGIEK